MVNRRKLKKTKWQYFDKLKPKKKLGLIEGNKMGFQKQNIKLHYEYIILIFTKRNYKMKTKLHFNLKNTI